MSQYELVRPSDHAETVQRKYFPVNGKVDPVGDTYIGDLADTDLPLAEQTRRAETLRREAMRELALLEQLHVPIIPTRITVAEDDMTYQSDDYYYRNPARLRELIRDTYGDNPEVPPTTPKRPMGFREPVLIVETIPFRGKPLADMLADHAYREKVQDKLTTIVNGLCEYYAQRVDNNTEIILHDIFKPGQWLANDDGEIRMIDTDVFATDANEAVRTGHEMTSLADLQTFVMQCGDSATRMKFLEWRDDMIETVAKKSGSHPDFAYRMLDNLLEQDDRGLTEDERQALLLRYARAA